MPIYDVTDEATGVTLSLEGDSPPSEQELTALFAQEIPKRRRELAGQQAEAVRESRRLAQELEPGAAESALRGFAQGTTFGLGEEIGAGVGALGAIGTGEGVSERYKRLRDDQRAQNRLARQRHPVAYTGAEIGGGLATGLATAAPAVAGQTLRQAIPRLAGIGAAEGGTAGLGYSEAQTVPGIAGDVALGATTGAALGTALPAVGAGLGAAARAVRRPFTAEAKTARQINKALRDDNLTLADAERKLADNPNLIVADLGENLQRRLGAIANQPGPTAQRARDILEQRNIDQLDRLQPKFEAALGGQGTLQALKESKSRAREAAGPLYEEAYASDIRGTARLQDLMSRPAAKAALKTAWKKAANEGVDISAPGSNVQIMDYMQRELRDRQQTLAPKRADDARIVEGLRKSILAEVDQQVPQFGEARRIWAGEAANQDALEYGAKIFREKTPNLRAAYDDMSQAEKEHFRIGVFDAVIDKLGTKVPTANLIQDFRKPKINEAMRIAFDDPGLFRQFQRTIGDEKRMFETMAVALQGSPTASRLAFDPAATTAQVAGDVMLGPGAGAAAQTVGRGLIDRLGQRFAGERAARIGDLSGEVLLGRSPGEMLGALTQPPKPSAQAGTFLPAATAPSVEQLLQPNR